ncbi:MAG: aldo/keto reductase [Sphaerochaeta sp.]|jgi:aryl-alcohol dehydrogenase-like predicted oxidoreductase|uniref:aldo/keto reductase n=1 Tax=Sphaerochaeta sp. TaxID=1972642 RepID=UPI002FC9B9B6
MKYLDFYGQKMAQIALGCDHYGETISEEISLRQLDIYVEHGGNLLDTAHIYGQDKAGGPSTSETVLGKWLQKNSSVKNLIVASKGCHPYKEDMHRSRINEVDMMLDISQTLDQLKTDSVDIWYFHRDNPQMGVDEIIDLASLLVDKKLVKYLGVSNWTAKRIAEANIWAKAKGKPTFAISEIQWSLAHCTKETWGDDTLVTMTEEDRLYYEANALPVMCFAPQAKGLFSKIIAGKTETLSETARRRFLTPTNLALVPKVKQMAEALSVTPAAIAMAYLTSQKNPTIAIAGSSRVEQITETLQGADLTLTEEQIAFFN